LASPSCRLHQHLDDVDVRRAMRLARSATVMVSGTMMSRGRRDGRLLLMALVDALQVRL